MTDSDHPDRDTLQKWLSFSLPDSVADSIEKHLETCEICSQVLEEIQHPGSELEDRVRAMSRGDSAGIESPEIESAETFVLDSAPVEPSGKKAGETMRHVTATWSRAASSDNYASHTIKGEVDVEAQQSVRLPINKRTTRHEIDEDAGDDADAEDYHLLQVIGKGGMGVVYSAKQSSIDRVVAVKMLKQGDEENLSRRRLFLQEAVVTADLDHPGIVPVHELGHNEEGTLFYSMKKVAGQTWRDVIGKKPDEENVELLMRVADAVAFAHSRGIVHRDIKPENVMLGRFGEVWLMDWGLAQPTPEYGKTALTTKQQMGGTPAYMAPEMAYGKDRIGPLSDIYLLGATLYQIVAGFPPHRGKTVMKCLLAAARNEIVPTDQTGGLVDVAIKAMATSPEDRYQTVEEFQEAIREWISHRESEAIAASASEMLEAATVTGNYQDFVRAIFGFEQAQNLNPANTRIDAQLADAQLAYAQAAYHRGDYDLAESLLDEDIAHHGELFSAVRVAKAEQFLDAQKLKRQQVALRSLLAAVAVLLVMGMFVASQLRSSALQLANVNEPAMAASLSLQSGIRRSLGALRGWVALGDEQFKAARSNAWAEEIRPQVAILTKIATDANNPESGQRLEQLNSMLDQLYEEQWWIEEVAQTPGNQPALDLLQRDIEPVESSIVSAFASLIDLEQATHSDDDIESVKVASAETNTVWATYARMQLDFSQTHRLLIDAVNDTHSTSAEGFSDRLKQLQLTVDELVTRDPELPQRELKRLEWIKGEIEVYRRLAQQALRLRASPQANVALWRLQTQALPTSQKTEKLLSDVVDEIQKATEENSMQINRVSLLAMTVGANIAIGVALAGVLSLMRRASVKKSLLASALVLCCSLSAQADESRADNNVVPGDVFANAQVVLGDLDLIRREMGKPRSEVVNVPVKNAEPHEVYFQALTLFEKVDELGFEITRTRAARPTRPQGSIQPANVLELVKVIQSRLETIKSTLGIETKVALPPVDRAKKPNDVFVAITVANRQANLLVERQFTPSDVFQQTTLAVSYCSNLLADVPGAVALPAEPAFERAKTPADVYRRLIACFARVRKIADVSGIKMLELEVADEAIAEATPSDVYDIASLLVSELAYLHTKHGGQRQPRRVFNPGRKFPSHCFQRAGMLENQIRQLEQYALANPNWLK